MNCDICVTLTLTVSIYGQKIEILLSVCKHTWAINEE